MGFASVFHSYAEAPSTQKLANLLGGARHDCADKSQVFYLQTDIQLRASGVCADWCADWCADGRLASQGACCEVPRTADEAGLANTWDSQACSTHTPTSTLRNAVAWLLLSAQATTQRILSSGRGADTACMLSALEWLTPRVVSTSTRCLTNTTQREPFGCLLPVGLWPKGVRARQDFDGRISSCNWEE